MKLKTVKLDSFLDEALRKILREEDTSPIFIKLEDLKHSQDPDSDFLPDQLEKGIKVEMEHTDNPQIAKAIAKAHLKENPRYYDFLEKMESQMKEET